jgi:hypothetical protein
MAAGVKFGRKRKLSDYQRDDAVKRRAAGETLASIAKSYGVHLAMISPALMPLRFYHPCQKTVAWKKPSLLGILRHGKWPSCSRNN